MNRKILIINGNPEPSKNKLNKFVSEFVSELQKNGEEVKLVDLQNKKIRQCTGCFDCWLKTPGTCRFKDDEEAILRDMLRSDLVIFSSPLFMGMYSSLLKRFQDRMIPLIHPYLEMVNNEFHHRKRYPKYPKLGFIFDKNDSSPEEIENIRFIHQRMVLNMHSELQLFDSIQQNNPKELSYEIINL